MTNNIYRILVETIDGRLIGWKDYQGYTLAKQAFFDLKPFRFTDQRDDEQPMRSAAARIWLHRLVPMRGGFTTRLVDLAYLEREPNLEYDTSTNANTTSIKHEALGDTRVVPVGPADLDFARSFGKR